MTFSYATQQLIDRWESRESILSDRLGKIEAEIEAAEGPQNALVGKYILFRAELLDVQRKLARVRDRKLPISDV